MVNFRKKGKYMYRQSQITKAAFCSWSFLCFSREEGARGWLQMPWFSHKKKGGGPFSVRIKRLLLHESGGATG